MAEEMQELSMRDTINAAFEAAEPASEDVPPEKEETPETPEPPEKPETPETPEKPEKPEAPAMPEKPETPPQMKFKAPGSWKPALREKWNSLPLEVQEEIIRRETEISRGLTSTAEARQLQQRFQQAIKPYETMIAAGSGDPIQTVSNMMKTAAILQMGTPIEKAQAAAQIINQFGVPLQALDSILAGQMPQGGVDPGIQQYLQQQLAPIHELAQRLRETTERSTREMETQAEQGIEAFAQDPKNEFFGDVRETMADILEMAAKRGQKMDLQSAYNRAIMMHDDIAQVVEGRKAAQAAEAAKRAAAEARRRGSSVHGAPTPETPGERSRSTSLRGDIEAAISQTSENS